MSLAFKAPEKYNYDDYLSWDDNHRWELINGIPYCMSPAPSTDHQKVTGEIFRQLSNYLLNKRCEVFISPFDIRFPESNEADKYIETVVQPDIVVVCDESKIDQRGCKGAPDLVIEVTSPSTIDRDIKDKYNLYEAHGVKEYWVVYPSENCIIVYTLSNNGGYGSPQIFTSSDIVDVKTIKGLRINLSEVFGKKVNEVKKIKPPALKKRKKSS